MRRVCVPSENEFSRDYHIYSHTKHHIKRSLAAGYGIGQCPITFFALIESKANTELSVFSVALL